MLKRRGGQKQKRKEEDVWNYHRDPERGASGKAVALLEMLGWEQGKGLGDGRGRLGKPWGLRGHIFKRFVDIFVERNTKIVKIVTVA